MIRSPQALIKVIKNIFDRDYKLIYIVEEPEWSINWDGKQLTENLNSLALIKSRTSTTPIGLKNKIIHFGSIHTIINHGQIVNVNLSNYVVLTWFHLTDNDKNIKFIPQLIKSVDCFHTASQNTKKGLIDLGIPSEKIVVIPLGVNLDYFRPADSHQKTELRTKLGLPIDKLIIGSFQKDGVGWKGGLQPKLIKGPDIFCEIMETLFKKNKNIHVLLTGPARDYVKERLKKSNIPYTHVYVKKYLDMRDYYCTLDCYLMTSRQEGGPKAILESWATAIPFIGTKVGMIKDIALEGENALFSEINDLNDLTEKVNKIITDEKFRQKLAVNGQQEVLKYNWSKIAKKYYKDIYNIAINEN
ncbi:MAG: glycosyltransferase family 4 protein [bacterium]